MYKKWRFTLKEKKLVMIVYYIWGQLRHPNDNS